MDNSDKTSTEHFLSLLTPVQGRIFAYILSRWPNKADAEDLMQDSITTMWNKFGDYKPGTDFQAWAITIAKYKVLNFRRKNLRSPVCFNNQALEALDGHAEDFLKQYDYRMGALAGCVKKLREADRKLVEMKYLREYPVARIAERYDVTTRMIYKTLSKIHNTLMHCVRRTLAESRVYE